MQVLGSDQNTYGNSVLLNYTQGIFWDQQLSVQEIRVQRAWAKGLVQAEVLTAAEGEALDQCLQAIGEAMLAGDFDWQVSDEDIHMNIEREVTAKLGDLGRKLHTGRSRNDLIATTLRLHVADIVEKTVSELQGLGQALADLAANHRGILVPGNTHLQHGQPLELAHILLAHAWPMQRVAQQLQLAKQMALANLPLGAAAFNGTTLAMDFESLAQDLGFAAPCANSYDAVSDRDAMLTLLQGFALHASHVGRFCEDVIYWASAPVGILKLPADWSTGSSIMPNKRNPDVCEITRAKTSRIVGQASAALNIVRGLGSSYFSDLHELKKVYLETCAELAQIHQVLQPFIGALEFAPAAATELLNKGHILATDYANELTAAGQNFRDAYKQVAAAVETADGQDQQIHNVVDTQVTFAASVAQRNQAGGTSADQIDQQLKSFRNAMQTWSGDL